MSEQADWPIEIIRSQRRVKTVSAELKKRRSRHSRPS